MTRTVRTIRLPALDRSVSLSAYITAVRTAKANPDATFKHGLTTWWPTTRYFAKEIEAAFAINAYDMVRGP